MAEYFAKSNIFDNNGRLLLSKGQRITDEVIARLKSHGYSLEELKDLNDKPSCEIKGLTDLKDKQNYESEKLTGLIDKPSIILVPAIDEFRAKMNISNDRLLKQPNEVLTTLIFESKSEPWWLYINALGNYIDWVYTHSIDVAMISMMLAVELGYSDEELFNIGLVALLHDVGKLLVPKSIMLKPSELSDMEMAIIRQHCDLGISCIEGFDIPVEYTNVVLQHHERLDGSGYPKGLKEDEIGRNSLIVIVADAVDAITSYRPYRQPRKLDAAISELKNEGEKYPQELVSLLEKMLL